MLADLVKLVQKGRHDTLDILSPKRGGGVMSEWTTFGEFIKEHDRIFELHHDKECTQNRNVPRAAAAGARVSRPDSPVCCDGGFRC